MSSKKLNDNSQDLKEVEDQKIQYGQNKIICFACGEQIDIGTFVCPYCNTKQNEKKSSLK
jgi:hypothetical protein